MGTPCQGQYQLGLLHGESVQSPMEGLPSDNGLGGDNRGHEAKDCRENYLPAENQERQPQSGWRFRLVEVEGSRGVLRVDPAYSVGRVSMVQGTCRSWWSRALTW